MVPCGMWSCMREKEIKAEGIHQAHLYSFILILKTISAGMIGWNAGHVASFVA